MKSLKTLKATPDLRFYENALKKVIKSFPTKPAKIGEGDLFFHPLPNLL